jgi:parvulin-like peptidyl-prolyl isomerase
MKGAGMKRQWPISLSVLVLPLVLATAATAGADDLPVVNGKKVAATVQGEPITLDEVRQQVDGGKRDQPTRAPASDGAEQRAVLDRLVNVVLIAQEARRMGLDKVSEIRKMVDANARITLREELVERVVKNVTADPKEVDELYRRSVREWKISAALFEKPEDARAMAAAVAAGGDFGVLARAALAGGQAKKLEDGVVLRREALDPEIARTIMDMAAGTTSGVVSTKSGHVVLRVDEVRHRDDPEARARAEQTVLTSKRRDAVTAFDEALRKKYVKVNRELLKAIDYDAATPGLDALLKDRRVLAEIKGEKPVTVAELTEALKFQFFHGAAMAAERKRLNAKKEQVLEGLLHRKVFRKEALRRGLDKTEAYKAKVRDYERSALFDAFVRKAILPGVRVTQDEVKAYYDDHRADYTTPEMIRIRSLAFASRQGAEVAAESLRKGADFQWVSDHAEAQVGRGTQGLLSFDGRPIMTAELPEGVRRAVTGTREGDVRLYESPENHVYVLVVQAFVPAAPRPYDDVRQEIAQKVFGRKIQKAVEEYAEKLRGLSEVKVYLKAL